MSIVSPTASDSSANAVAISLVQIAHGFNAPVQVTHAGDESGRLFVVEQSGRIVIIQNDVVLPQPFLDLRHLVDYGGEKGLLGLAFHLQYKQNGYFYVNYTRIGDGATVIARYQALPSSNNQADANSAAVLLVIPQPYSNHNGGQLQFSPLDGYLYIGMGDGGSGGDPLDHGQNINTLLGALLRIDVDQSQSYRIPPDNPFVNQPGLDEIWSIGLRNPWRFSFDRLNGDLYIGDVGQNLWEEVDFQAGGTPGGLNYGWRCKEGFHTYNFSSSCASLTLVDPIAEYSHTEGRSITGGYVYRGANYPAMQGRYFYADYVTGKIWNLWKTSENPLTWSPPSLMLETGMDISAFGEDESGELYVVSISQGAIYQVVDATGPVPNFRSSRKSASSISADAGETVTYTIALINTGGLPNGGLWVTDTIPPGLSYIPGTLSSPFGFVNDASAPLLTWQADISDAPVLTLTYQVQVTGAITGSLVNTAQVSSSLIHSFALSASLFTPRSQVHSTINDFRVPGTQPGMLSVPVQPSADCDICHSASIYDAWRGSMMSQSGRDPLFWAAVATANVDAPESGELCLRCHLSTGWLAGRSHPSDGSAFIPSDISNGVACHLCHRLVDSNPGAGDALAVTDLNIRNALTLTVPIDYTGSAALIVDPNDNRRGPFSFSQDLPYHTAYQTDYFAQDNDAITRSRLCGSCHNVDNPVLEWDTNRAQYWPNTMDSPASDFDGVSLFPVERTFDEWLYSQYAQGGVYAPQFAGMKNDGIVAACQDCHMPRASGLAADAAFNPIFRACGVSNCLPEHTLTGANTWIPRLLKESAWRLDAIADSQYLDGTLSDTAYMLRRAATMTVTLTQNGPGKQATVRVTNQSGHKLPTGYPEGRQMWLHIQAFDGNDQLVYASGSYDFTAGQLLRDPDVKVYEVKQGITPELAAFLNQPAGESFHFVLNNTVMKDNRIPPRGYLVTTYDKPGLRPVAASYGDGQYWDDTIYNVPVSTQRVLVTLYYQTASAEYIDFLNTTGGVDGLALKALWDGSRSPPVVVAQSWTPDYVTF
ncbi:MAG: PQQ-dependent sugar dehydrogenase, partial [Anaerolineae bacterium]|nr:PQQ-dependent sugar dehydrogenase [Anaerolineae bacterium]